MKHKRCDKLTQNTCRPFTGAWIETTSCDMLLPLLLVAPSRGRGLKLEPFQRRTLL